MELFKDWEFKLRTCDTDMNGFWRPSNIFISMQEAAELDVLKYNLDFATLREKNIAWIIVRTHLTMNKYPKIGDVVKLRTWPGPIRRCFFARGYTFTGEDGTLFGSAYTMWVLIDIPSRTMFPGVPEGLDIPQNLDIEMPVAAPGRINPLEAEPNIFNYTPLYCDMDINGHVNNTRYIDWFCDRVPFDYHKEKMLSDIVIHYDTEVMPGCDIRLDYRVLGDEMTFTGVSDGDAGYAGDAGSENRHFIIKAQFGDRKQ